MFTLILFFLSFSFEHIISLLFFYLMCFSSSDKMECLQQFWENKRLKTKVINSFFTILYIIEEVHELIRNNMRKSGEKKKSLNGLIEIQL